MSRLTQSTRTTRGLLAATAIALVPLMAACGSDAKATALPKVASSTAPSDNASPGAPVDKAAADDAFAKFQDCMSAHGMQPAGTSGATIPSNDVINAAWAACQPILDKAGIQPAGGNQGVPADLQKQLLAVAKCMRAKGWDVPDPKFQANGSVQMATPSDPAAQKDADECTLKYGPKMGVQ